MDRKNLEQYDVVIIGGGIVGAGLFREQSLHNIKSLIVDQADFNSQTSQGSSKMLHGGIRYLENMDFSLVFEALREKNLWLKLTPHLTKEIPFYLPVYKESKWPLFFLRIGLWLYDTLSLYKNSPYRILNIKQTLKEMPGIKQKGLTGSGVYFDGIVDDSKLGLECIYDGLNNPNCQALNYTKVTKVEETKENSFIVTLKDLTSEESKTVHSKHVIFATGPFTDQTMKELNIDWTPRILPSKGIHLWMDKESLPIDKAMVLQTRDGRIIFVIPQRDAILVGTTEHPIDPETNMLNIQPTNEEITYLIGVLNDYFPESNIKEEHILSSFAAVRPLVRSSASSSKTSRMHKIFEPKPNMHVLIGGKYTTFRSMAEHLNKKIFKKLGVKHNRKLTLQPLRETSIVKNPFQDEINEATLKNIISKEFVKTKEDLIARRLSFPSEKQISHELQDLINKTDLK